MAEIVSIADLDKTYNPPMLQSLPLDRIALIGTFPPRRCGIATFTQDTYNALIAGHPGLNVDVYAMANAVEVADHDIDVNRIGASEKSDYKSAARQINESGADLVWLQHEFGIFGGNDGEMVLDLIKPLQAPLAITLHTLLERPSANQRRIMEILITKADILIVMAEKARLILQRFYAVDPNKIMVIPHGIPDVPYSAPDRVKPQVNLAGRDVILTFGLLSADKGIGDMIEAMPQIVKGAPNAVYVVLGATHPNVLTTDGEALRHALQARVTELGLENNVLLIDSYVDLPLLTLYLQAADIYVTPYHNPSQITSGTLSYAVGLGKPVVSTPYIHATELLANGTGVLVPFRDPAALASAVSKLLVNDVFRKRLARRAYTIGRSMTWSCYAYGVLSAFAEVVNSVAHHPKAQFLTRSAGVSSAALARLTDGTGMLQHSRFGIADRNHGYCIDDNARALALVSIADDMPHALRNELGHTYAAFIQHAWNSDLGIFRNFMHFDRHWLEVAGSSDSNGRALLSLSAAATHHNDPLIRQWANELYREAAPKLPQFRSPRTIAFCMLAALQMEEYGLGLETNLSTIRTGAENLLMSLQQTKRAGWLWFESGLSYDNCRIPEALIRAGNVLLDTAVIAAGMESMDWVMQMQTTDAGLFRPIGSEGFHDSFSQPKHFDQQPVEALAAIEGCLAASLVEPEEKWLTRGEAAFSWFLGKNDLGLTLADFDTGECYDGLTPSGVNFNRGAESVLAWQASVRQIGKLREAFADLQGVTVRH